MGLVQTCGRCGHLYEDGTASVWVCPNPSCHSNTRNWSAAARAAGWVSREEHERVLAELRHYKEREQHFAKAMAVADGGQYRNDWDGAIARLISDRDTALAELRARRVLDEEHKSDCGNDVRPYDYRVCTCGLSERQEEARRVIKKLSTAVSNDQRR